MKKLTYIILLIALSTTGILFASGNKEKDVQDKKITIAVSILPQKYAVDRIAGNLVETIVLVGEGQSPHSYEPTPRQMSALSSARAWILSGTDFEQALIGKITSLYPNLLIIDGTKGVTFRLLEEHDHDDHDDDYDDDDDDDDDFYDDSDDDRNNLRYDKHTWLSYEPYKILVNHIYRTLVKIDAQHSEIYKTNMDQFIDEIDALFSSLYKELAFLKGSKVFVFHPSFGYLFDEFGIIQEAVETGGKEPTAKNLVALIEEAREERVKVIFVQSQFPVEAAKNVANAVGAKVLPLNPLAYDWINNIKSIASALLEASK